MEVYEWKVTMGQPKFNDYITCIIKVKQTPLSDVGPNRPF